MRQLVLHIGTHKTGSTSFQHALDRASDALELEGIHTLRDRVTPLRGWAHELQAVVLRESLDFPLRRMFPELSLSSVQETLRQNVLLQMQSSQPVVIASHEDLSFIRTEAEVHRLVSIAGGREIRVAVVLRDPDAFLASWRGQLRRMYGVQDSAYPDSCLYTQPGSWLTDWASMIRAFQGVLGAEALTVLNYEELVHREGSVVPALWRACGLPERLLPSKVDRWQNVSPSISRHLLRRAKRVVNSVLGRISPLKTSKYALPDPLAGSDGGALCH